MSKPSKEVKALHGKEGSIVDVLKAYLDVKKVNYSIAKPKPGKDIARIEGVFPFVEPGSIIMEKNGKKFIVEKLTKVCGASGRFHERNEMNVDSVLDKTSRFVLSTRKNSKNLNILTNTENGEMTVEIKDILREPSNIPGYDETYEIKCKCDRGKLKCKGDTWDF